MKKCPEEQQVLRAGERCAETPRAKQTQQIAVSLTDSATNISVNLQNYFNAKHKDWGLHAESYLQVSRVTLDSCTLSQFMSLCLLTGCNWVTLRVCHYRIYIWMWSSVTVVKVFRLKVTLADAAYWSAWKTALFTCRVEKYPAVRMAFLGFAAVLPT